MANTTLCKSSVVSHYDTVYQHWYNIYYVPSQADVSNVVKAVKAVKAVKVAHIVSLSGAGTIPGK